MRADICHYYSGPIEVVFNAYKAAVKEAFKSDAEGTPYHSLTFSLSYSFKYNMNGGGCHIHLMPHGDGTAVDIRYTIAQAFGAKYKAHDRDMTAAVERILGIPAQDIQINVESFMQYKNEAPSTFENVQEAMNEPQAVSVAETVNEIPHQPVAAAESSRTEDVIGTAVHSSPVGQQKTSYANFCTKCGHAFGSSADKFCPQCGAKRRELQS